MSIVSIFCNFRQPQFLLKTAVMSSRVQVDHRIQLPTVTYPISWGKSNFNILQSGHRRHTRIHGSDRATQRGRERGTHCTI